MSRNLSAKESLELGLQQSAAGELEDLGDFTQYLEELEEDDD